MNGSELDFWLGSWHVAWKGGDGTNNVARELDGQVVVERFEGRPALELQGLSVSVFDAESDLWRQTWVDDQGATSPSPAAPKETRSCCAPPPCAAACWSSCG